MCVWPLKFGENHAFIMEINHRRTCKQIAGGATGCLIAALFVESEHKQNKNFIRRIEGAQQMSPGKILQTAGRRLVKTKGLTFVCG